MEEWDPDVGLEDFPTELRELLVDDAAGLREAFEQVQAQWDETIARAKALPEPKRHESVDGEWSLTRTLRHLVYATDIWISRLVFGESQPYHPWGQPFTELEDLDALGLDLDAEPSFAAVLEVRASRVQRVRGLLAGLTDADLDRECVPPDQATHPAEPHPLKICLWTVIEEEWWHHRFFERDLTALEAR